MWNPAILLVEDNEGDVVLLQSAFRNAKLANPLFVVRDGQEAIKYLSGDGDYTDRSRHPMPFLILLDLRLPKLSGFEVIEWIRDQPGLAELVVVVLTASDYVPNVTKAHQLGANAYLVKPGTFDELVDLVKGIRDRWLILDRLADSRASSEVPRATEKKESA